MLRVVLTQAPPGAEGWSASVRATLLSLGAQCPVEDCVSFARLPGRLARGGVDLVLVRLRPAGAALAAVRQAASVAVPVLVVGPGGNPRRVQQALWAGARGYLDEAHLARDLETALETLRRTGQVRWARGLVVGVLSATPGAGVTTVATHLAFTWAEAYHGRVTLAELGRDTPSLAAALDVEPAFTTADVASVADRLDADLLRAALVRHEGGVQVLAQSPDSLGGPALPARAVRRLAVLLRNLSRVAVLDLGHALGDEHFEALRVCDRVVLVVRPDVPGLRQARRLLEECRLRGVPRERLWPVVNRHGQKGQVPWQDAEEALGVRFVAYLPDDAARLNQSLNLGRPLGLVNPRARICRRFAKLAEALGPW
jgi:pilus assembly protein CpaE